MEQSINPEMERIYSQLLWIERRCSRIIESVAAHFGRPQVEKILTAQKLLPAPLHGSPRFSTLLDDRDADVFLEDLSFQLVKYEGDVITAIRKHVSVYREHVDEQILFGARTAGQEAGREFLTKSKSAIHGRSHLEVPEAVQAVFELTFTGLPRERNYFLSLRPLGGCTVHFQHSPNIQPWKEAGADTKFLYAVNCEWVKGIIDILSPEVTYTFSSAIEHGNNYGLAHFYIKDRHAGP